VAKTKASTAKKAVARKSAKTTRRATTRKGTTKTRAVKTTARKTKKKTAAKKSARTTPAPKQPKPDKTVPVDRRRDADRRSSDERRKKHEPVAVERRTIERRAKVNRRRQIDPTTCERDYTTEELEFMSALDEYKRTSGRMFPTCSEILEVIRGLGYQRVSRVEENGQSPAGVSVAGVLQDAGTESFEHPGLTGSAAPGAPGLADTPTT